MSLLSFNEKNIFDNFFLVVVNIREKIFRYVMVCLIGILSCFMGYVTSGIAVNEFGHVIVYSFLQSIITNSFKEGVRGFRFGLWGLSLVQLEL